MGQVSFLCRQKLLAGFIVGLAVALFCSGLSLVLPSILTANYYEKSLRSLRNQARTIEKEFISLEVRLEQRMADLLRSPFPMEQNRIFELFQKSSIDPAIDGLAYYEGGGNLAIWRGNVIDFPTTTSFSSRVVRTKASVYLLTARRIRQSEAVVVSRLLAFQPPLKAPYLEDYHFLKQALKRNCHVDYWDFREDVSGFEKIFARHKDEYIGKPRFPSEILTIFFPIRNSQRQIVATVNLSSPSLATSQSLLRENLILASTLLVLISLSLLLLFLARVFLLTEKKRLWPVGLFLLALVGLRLILLQLSHLEKIQAWPIFSPGLAAFVSWGDLTKSPADIFLSSFFLFLIFVGLTIAIPSLLKKTKLSLPAFWSWSLTVVALMSAVVLVFVYEKILARLVFNSNINLLRFRLDLTVILLHFSLVFLFLGVCLLLVLIFRFVRRLIPDPAKPLAIFLLLLVGRSFREGQRGVLLLIEAAGLVFLFFLARGALSLKKREVIFTSLVLASLFNFALLQVDSTLRLESILQDFLPNTILSQENWADFLLRQSIPALEARGEAILAFLRTSGPGPLARSLWENTLVAKFNWYSTLEILGPDGQILSRFSLNIPQLFRPDIDLPLSPTWSVFRLRIPSLGKEREFVFGYKDWLEEGRSWGRITFYLAVDPEMLPFLYSANPYFELLKVSSLPSLNQQEFGFAIFDLTGKMVFNPNKMAAGISPSLLSKLTRSSEPEWGRFRDRNKSYLAYYFQLDGRIYSFFAPRPNFLVLSVEFLKLFFLYSGLLLLYLLLRALAQRKKLWRNFLWSFSSRVYAAFLIITLASLCLYSFFSRNFFNRLFSERFLEKAEVHAHFARNVMQDFALLQEEEKTTLIAPTDDLVLWISSAIANDVSLYSEGRLVSSSRREFYDWGLLSEIIDGETYYLIWHEHRPYHIQRQKIGSYSFQSLTIPYSISESRFLISLPFPFEEEEIHRATEELVEFLVFVSVFFISFVLLFARAMGRAIISPVQKLLAGTREASLGNLDISIEHRSHDEMKTLIDGFNAMIKNLKRHQQEIADLSKKAAWAEMAQRIAHEIKNPLTPIQLSAEHLLRVYEDQREDFEKAIKESISYIITEVENLRRIAQEFLELSRASSLKKEPFDLRGVLEEVVSPYRKMLAERIKFREVYEGESFSLLGDKSKIKIAFRNVFVNAIEALPGKGVVEIQLSARPESLILQVKDSGPGMRKEVLERIFDPYFSTKELGTGLGLPIAKKIVEDHGGSIQVESEVGKGTSITLSLPRG